MRFLDHPNTTTGFDQVYRSAVKVFKNHQHSYNGGKVYESKWDKVMKILWRGNPRSKQRDYWGFKVFGYNKNAFGTELGCSQWLDQVEDLARLGNVVDRDSETNELFAVGSKPYWEREVEH